VAAVCAVGFVLAATPPAGFEDHQVVDPTSATGAANPVGIAYEPGTGALFVAEKGDGTLSGTARVRRRNPANGAVTTALTLTCVDSVGERGLLGMAFDPDYLDGSRHVYLFYTRAVASGACAVAGFVTGSYNWVVRYQESGGVLVGEQRLLSGPELGPNNHQGGSVRFGPDKSLYVSMGDNDTDAYPVPASRDLNDLRGKILRITKEGDIPAGNPFIGQAGKRAEIWAWGLRNPFRISIDDESGNVYIGDVGEGGWEEINTGIAGADYGWPCFEANTAFRACSPPPIGDVRPSYAYGHNGQTPPVEGDSVIAGPIYHGASFPPDYEGQFFFGDYGGGWIRRATILPNGTFTDVTMFVPDAVAIVDMAVSPAGCLTWVSIGGLGVHDVCYAGGSNAQPQARSTGAPLSGLAPLNVQFNGTASSDADQDLLSYSWAFGDGTTSSAPTPLKTYSTNGVRDAVLTVNDGTGTLNATDTAPALRVVVGNRSPEGTITSPPAGTHYDAGDQINYSGSGTDPEDGTLPASAFSWTVVFHHDEHTHPLLGPVNGVTSGSFTIPTSGEDATDVFYRIEMTVKDSGAPLGAPGVLMKSAFVDVVPNLTTITVAAAPPGAGLALEIDHVEAPAPFGLETVVKFPRMITAPSPQTVRGATWTFASWSDGGPREHVVSPPTSPATYTATYQCTSGCAFTPALTLGKLPQDATRLQWPPLACALSYDIVRGNLTTLRATGGNFTLATAACLANDITATTVDDPKVTTPSGLFWLVRANGCGWGSFDEVGVPWQPASRDAEIAASAQSCP
jgi:glucose/arabinose dehydrogenase/PKD repeat protein